MAVILDTHSIVASRRPEAVIDAFGYASVPCEVTHRCRDNEVWSRMTYVQLGPGADVLLHEGSAVRLTRRAQHLRLATPERLSLAVQGKSSGGLTQRGQTLSLGGGEMVLVDLTSPYDYWNDGGGQIAFQIDYAELGISVPLARKAASSLPVSPVYGMVRSHLRAMCQDIESIGSGPGAPAVTRATTELLRALIVSAVGDSTSARDAMAEALLPRVLHYLRARISDPDLSLEQIAAVHDVSVPTLTRAWSPMGIDLPDWIIAEREQNTPHTTR